MARFLGARTAALLACTVTTSLTLSSLPATAQAAVDLKPTFDFYTKLFAENQGMVPGYDGSPSPASTVDALFAYLASAQTEAEQRKAHVIFDGLKPHFDKIATNPGTLAKVVALQAAFGDIDSSDVAELKSKVADNGDTGQTTFAAAWIPLALARTGEKDTAQKALDFIKTKKCVDGNYSWSTPCTTGDTDTTVMVALAAGAVEGKDSPEVSSAVAFLKSKLNSDGGIDGGWGANTNSTGLAASLFFLAGDTESLGKTQSFLESARFGADKPELAGAFAYTPASKATDTAVNSQNLMATGQAAVGYAGKSYTDVTVSASAPVFITETTTVTETTTEKQTETTTATVTKEPEAPAAETTTETTTVTLPQGAPYTTTETTTQTTTQTVEVTPQATPVTPAPGGNAIVTETVTVTDTAKETVTQTVTETQKPEPGSPANPTATVTETATTTVEVAKPVTTTVTATATATTTVNAKPSVGDESKGSSDGERTKGILIGLASALGAVGLIISGFLAALWQGIIVLPSSVTARLFS